MGYGFPQSIISLFLFPKLNKGLKDLQYFKLFKRHIKLQWLCRYTFHTMKRFKDLVTLFQIFTHTHNHYSLKIYIIKENKNLISLLLCQSNKNLPTLTSNKSCICSEPSSTKFNFNLVSYLKKKKGRWLSMFWFLNTSWPKFQCDETMRKYSRDNDHWTDSRNGSSTRYLYILRLQLFILISINLYFPHLLVVWTNTKD